MRSSWSERKGVIGGQVGRGFMLDKEVIKRAVAEVAVIEKLNK